MKKILIPILTIIIAGIFLYNSNWFKKKDYILDTSKVKDFHQHFYSTEKKKLNEAIDLFVDYSTCLSKKETDKSVFYKAIHPKIIDCNPTFWSIKGQVIKSETKDQQQVYTLLNSINEVNYADIKTAVENIVKSKNQAILITDGEYFQHNGNGDNYNNPYLSSSFKTWLKNGHDIYIYSESYMENNKSAKYRYYFLFTDRNIEDNIYHKLSKAVTLSETVKLTKLSSTDFNVYTKYDGVSQPKVNDVLSINPFSYFASKDFEFQEYQIGWEDIVEFIQNTTDPTTDEPIADGDFVLRGIFVDTKSLDYFTIDSIEVKVYNAYDAFRTFEDTSYFSKTKELKQIKELFKIDKEAFRKDREIVLKIHKKFVGVGLNNEDEDPQKENLLKVDIIISSAKDNFNSKQEDFRRFKFKSIDPQTNGMDNESLYQSIKNTLEDASINPQKVNSGILYTIYIKTPTCDL